MNALRFPIQRPQIQIIFLVVLFLFSCRTFYLIFFQPPPAIQNLSFVKGNYQKMSEGSSLYLSAMEAKKFLPSNARIEFSPAGFNIYRIAARYLLYPLELSDHWNYFIDFDHSMINPPDEWNVFMLSTGVRIFAKPGYDILQAPNPVSPYSGFKAAITLIIVLAINLAIGWLLFKILPWKQLSETNFHILGTGFIAIFFSLAMVLWLFLLWGGTLEQNALIILWAMTSLILLLVFQEGKTVKSKK